MIPIGDYPNPRGVPYVTVALIVVNVAIFLLVTLPLGGQAPDPRDPLYPEYRTWWPRKTRVRATPPGTCRTD